jgi:sterol desaturase/sphingolipid hydroxylase (fatty acid hydroxylase superfamily)
MSLWDRLLGSYCAQPSAGHLGMTIGLREYQHEDRLGLMQLVLMPFRTPEADSAKPAGTADRR